MERVCSRCGVLPARPSGRWCRRCHAAYMREHRRANPPTETQRRHGIARAIANVYLRRGKITRQPCEVCGAPAQMHHDDYSRPLDVRWLCRDHHLAHHRS